MSFEKVAMAVLLVFCLLLVAMLALLYHKLSGAIDRLSKQMPKVGDNVITQIEALLAINQELRFPHALPATRGWAASPDLLRVLMNHALGNQPEVMVECSSGISTLVLARCAQLNGRGHVYSLEHDAEYAGKTRELLQRHGLSEYATVLDAGVTNYRLNNWDGNWYSIAGLPDDLAIDMLAIDGPPWFTAPMARYPAMPLLFDRLNVGAAIFLDDADRDDEQLAVGRWLVEYPRLRKLQLPICEKGCVGLTLC